MSISEDQVKDMLINPMYAIIFSESLFADNPSPLVTREQWIQANARLIQEIGAEEWLRRLLNVLETGGVTSEDTSD